MKTNNNPKVCLITGCTGQDGRYLSELLLEKGYIVHGLIRRASTINTERIDHLYKDPHEKDVHFFLHYGDMSDSGCIERLVSEIKPDEVYNLAAMSHVLVSFDMPEYTGDVDGLGTLRLLEACRKLKNPVKFYQAGTSELYGGIQNQAQNELTPFHPRSPYAVAKLYAYWITINYREAYDMFCCNGILFNHTSAYRGHTFVEQKIVQAAVKIKYGQQDCLYLGNLYASRDIGHAKDYVQGMWMMMQAPKPKDYVLATGETHTVKEIVDKVFEFLDMDIEWEGEGINEIGKVDGQVVIRIDSRYFRPAEVDILLGDSTKAQEELGWKPTYTFEEILQEMISHEKNKST